MARSTRHANRLVGCGRAVKACNTGVIATVLHRWMGGLTWGVRKRIVYYTTAGTVPALGVILVEETSCAKRDRDSLRAVGAATRYQQHRKSC